MFLLSIISGDNELNFPITPNPIANGGIADNTFSDDDSNDIRGAFEVGISTDISILGTNYSTTSKPNGNYSFLNIPVGEYQVRVTPPSGYGTDIDTKPVTVSEYQNSIVNFALTPDPTSLDSTTIYGVVFSDTNWNGIQDEGESGIANYTMMAIYGQELLHDITDNDGRYSIDVSPRVSYHVRTQFFPQGHVVYDEKSS
ncbi:MAG: carboxypeptidase regulatory-like domain-containing protein [Thaumarchaeota archaeon]|nr:carboxypeptidase regulatory-like domain-containing protein [Nitrososphaerota archaeon]